MRYPYTWFESWHATYRKLFVGSTTIAVGSCPVDGGVPATGRSVALFTCVARQPPSPGPSPATVHSWNMLSEPEPLGCVPIYTKIPPVLSPAGLVLTASTETGSLELITYGVFGVRSIGAPLDPTQY